MAARVDYQTYLASREWRLKRKEVIEGNDGLCYRCLSAPIDDVHHLTYERVGHEDTEDLIGVCRPCHEYLAARRDDDPAEAVIRAAMGAGLEPEMCNGHEPNHLMWWSLELPNGRYYNINFKPSPERDAPEFDYIDYSIIFEIEPGVWAHCWWC